MCQQLSTLALFVTLSALPGLLLAAGAPAEAEPAPTTADVENITVTGQRPEVLRQKMEDFIVEIGDPASDSRGYARWQDRLCVGVYNLPDQSAAQYIVDKITINALEVGLRTGRPGCTPNLHIIFSPDARALASSMVEASPQSFRPFGNTPATTQGAAALEQFRTSDAPVRWWQITMVVDETGQAAIELPGLEMPYVRAVASRIKSTVSDAIWGSVVIVDARMLHGVKWPQLADYLTMVALAQVDPNALPSGEESILSLFSAGNPPRGMTELDLSYLHALYEIDTMMLPYTQRGLFSSRMVRELGKLQDPE